MSRTALSNSLIGKFVVPIWHLRHIFVGANITPPAEVVAAWTEEGSTKINCVDRAGHVLSVYLENVRLFSTVEHANGYMSEYKRLDGERAATEAVLEEALDHNIDIERRKALSDQIRTIEKLLCSL